MNTKETAWHIFDSLSERQLEAFIMIFKPLAENNAMLNEELVTVEVAFCACYDDHKPQNTYSEFCVFSARMRSPSDFLH